MNNLLIKNLPFKVKQTSDLNRRIKLAILPELAEEKSIEMLEKHFNQKFTKGQYNSKGFDVISEDGSIIVEVKQTSCPHNKMKVNLQINSTWPKYKICTHMMIFDFYNDDVKVSLISHDDFFNSTFHGPTKIWRWDIDYGTRMKGNTQLFLNNLVKL
jgi:hypothetical protein